MKINQEIDVHLTPQQIARYIYGNWSGDDIIKFANESGQYISNWKDIFNTAGIEDLNVCGRSFVELISCSLRKKLGDKAIKEESINTDEKNKQRIKETDNNWIDCSEQLPSKSGLYQVVIEEHITCRRFWSQELFFNQKMKWCDTSRGSEELDMAKYNVKAYSLPLANYKKVLRVDFDVSESEG